MHKAICFTFALFLFSSCAVFRPYEVSPKREFRGVWIATVVNIDWPKNGTDTAAKQKQDYVEILNFYQKENYNAVIVQIRAAGDAFYKSDYAPWSRFLTGKEGEKPEWNTDVLEWMIAEAHKRGMEFHAWLNPFRATFDENFEVLSPTHDYCKHPEWMIHYGKKNYYNPGLPEVRNTIAQIVAEVVSKYDVDGIHFDDYFYPYKITGAFFNDTASYHTYAVKGKTIEDWRRSNIDSLIKTVHTTVKTLKPWVTFGVSPFGVWKNNNTDPKGSDTRAGQTTFDDLYADPLLWMQNGWLDYLAPQVYWSMHLPVASHEKIVNWWAKNQFETTIYIGNGAYKIRNNKDAAWHNKKELAKQIALARKTPQVAGNIMFSATSLMKNKEDVVKLLHKKFYKQPSLTPLVNNLKETKNEYPVMHGVFENSTDILLSFKDISQQRYALLYASSKKNKGRYPMKKLLKKIFITNNTISLAKKDIQRKHVAISFIDKYGRESITEIVQVNHRKSL